MGHMSFWKLTGGSNWEAPSEVRGRRREKKDPKAEQAGKKKKYGQKSCMLLMRLQTAVYGEAQPNRHERKAAVLTKFGVFTIEAGLELQMAEDGFEKKKDAGKHVLFNLQNSSSRT